MSKPITKIRVLINLKSPLSTPSLKLLICHPRLSALRGRILQIFNQNSTIQPPAPRAAAREIPIFFLGAVSPVVGLNLMGSRQKKLLLGSPS